jgi:hypothetical protein
VNVRVAMCTMVVLLVDDVMRMGISVVMGTMVVVGWGWGGND